MISRAEKRAKSRFFQPSTRKVVTQPVQVAGCPPHPYAANITVTVTSVEDTLDGWYTLHGTAKGDPTVFNFPDDVGPVVIRAGF